MEIMRGENTWEMLLYALVAVWLLRQWILDLRSNFRQENQHGLLPGAYTPGLGPLLVASLVAVFILILETSGEYFLGIKDEQETIAFAFIFAMLAAAIIEEIIFRGYLVVTHKGKTMLWISIVGFSVIFALLHPYCWDVKIPDNLWALQEWQWTLKLDKKSIFSTFFIFINSLWFYTVRFMPNNPKASLLPCFLAHGIINIGVFIIKAFQGFIVYPQLF